MPYVDDEGKPLLATQGHNKGLVLYDAEWHPDVQTGAATAMKEVIRDVKDEPGLGADVTSSPNQNKNGIARHSPGGQTDERRWN